MDSIIVDFHFLHRYPIHFQIFFITPKVLIRVSFEDIILFFKQ
ncbi:hypothetical protein LEP1GSC052_0071 [Leptospira phage vb_LkmZ_Bejolso9-LE1]|nr:hypothetical protein LEP1GSC052_0071 [Leptospira phage vb_LkmZ_Bejolso9-LE1]